MTEPLVAVLKDWPWAVLIVALIGAVAYGAKALTTVKDAVLAPLGSWLKKISRRERDRIDSELADLRRQVEYLAQQVGDMRLRDECYWEFVIHVQDHQRRRTLLAIENNWDLPEHHPFMDFREAWLKQHKNFEPLTP